MSSENFYDYIEIGTADFETEVQKTDGGFPRKGISIDCIKYYLDRLPDKDVNTKLNLAISDSEGEVECYYLDENSIMKYNLPDWVKGCNSIMNPHPIIVELLKDKGIDDNIFKKDIVKKITLYQLFQNYNIHGVYYLKIDTEGHDIYILSKFYEDYTKVKDNRLLPYKLLFESNILSDYNKVEAVINKYSNIGYDCTYSNKKGDTMLRLNLNKIWKNNIFSAKIKRHYLERDLPDNYYVIKNGERCLPHENNLESAKEYCLKHKCNGIQYFNGLFEVRKGKYICGGKIDSCCWILL